ncbi:MAG: FAD-binding oxidoreductase [Deltaproteobacteria bacterium]|nr:FAD-binding oxidoreductase [Deltaproteobacteria bacterium]
MELTYSIIKNLFQNIDIFSNNKTITAKPDSTIELSRLMRECSRRNIPLLATHKKPLNSEGLLIDLTALDSILYRDKKSLIIQVQTGVKLGSLENTLRKEGLTLNCFFPGISEMTLWEVISNGYSLPGFQFFGPRGVIAGFNGIMLSGDVITSRVVPERNYGIDFFDLFLGKKGKFGIITDIYLRVNHLETPVQPLIVHPKKKDDVKKFLIHTASTTEMEPLTSLVMNNNGNIEIHCFFTGNTAVTRTKLNHAQKFRNVLFENPKENLWNSRDVFLSGRNLIPSSATMDDIVKPGIYCVHGTHEAIEFKEYTHDNTQIMRSIEVLDE